VTGDPTPRAEGRRQVLRNCRVFTSAGPPIEHGAVVIEAGRVVWVGREAEIGASPGRSGTAGEGVGEVEEHDLGGRLVTPGLVDAHTHPVYGGDRYPEISLRSSGASYGEIAAAGGGIASTVAATRATPLDELAAALEQRLDRWLAGGATTVEAKTGYHLDEDGELGATRLLARAAAHGTPSVEVTYLGGHAVGPEWSGDPDGYIAEAARWCAGARSAGARHADVFCDEGYFTIEQGRVLLRAAKAAGLICRIHADELACTGGAELAGELGCASADHLLLVDEAGIRALAAVGVVATLAPVTALAMGRTPPAGALLEAGVTIALGSDHNPGTCGTTSMSLVVALAVAELGLSVSTAVQAATSGGARSLCLDDRGQLVPGKRADLVCWEADHEGAFAWSYGLSPHSVWVEGRRAA
jgi:imidazolonepropionase